MRKLKIKKRVEKLLKSDFFRVFSLIRENKKMCILLIFLDVLAFLLFYGINLTIAKISERTTSPEAIMLLLLLNICILLLVYSFFKNAIMKIITSFLHETALDFRGFGGFLSLNTITLILAGGVFFAVSSLVDATVRPEYIPSVLYFASSLLFIIFYVLINTAHFMFLKEMKVGRIFKKIFGLISEKKKSYGGMLLGSLNFFILFYLLYVAVHLIANLIAPSSPEAQLGFVHAYSILLNILMMLFIYFLMFFNRIYFKLIVEKR